MEYNYKHFKPRYYIFDEFLGPRLGEKALDFSARTLDGKAVHLSQFFGKPIVLETGSITCPVFTGKIERMNQFVKQYSNTQFVVLYVRESHPGTRISGHSTEEEKVSNAKRLKEETGDNRLILVDDLEGTAHKKYGLFPDMVYVIDHDGTVVCRARWNDLDALGNVLEAMSRGSPLPNTESQRFVNAPKPSLTKFAIGGWDALLDFLLGLPRLIFHNFVKRK